MPVSEAFCPGTSRSRPVVRGTTIEIYAVIDDDGKGKGTANECNEKNNRAELGKVKCTTIN